MVVMVYDDILQNEMSPKQPHKVLKETKPTQNRIFLFIHFANEERNQLHHQMLTEC